MRSQLGFLSTITALLDRCEIPYMVAGSVASSFHGEPRATRDVDIIVECQRRHLRPLVAGLRALDCYVSEEAATHAIDAHTAFNVIDPDGGWKADLIVRRDRAYSVEEFRRRISARLLGEDAPMITIVSAEDSMLSKLEWHAHAASQQQLRDARSIIRVRGADLDLPYLRRWARTLGVLEDLERLVDEDGSEHPGP